MQLALQIHGIQCALPEERRKLRQTVEIVHEIEPLPGQGNVQARLGQHKARFSGIGRILKNDPGHIGIRAVAADGNVQPCRLLRLADIGLLKTLEKRTKLQLPQ